MGLLFVQMAVSMGAAKATEELSPTMESLLEEEEDITFEQVLSQINIKTQVENVIYTLNVQFSELKTIVEAHTGFIKALRTKNEAFRIGKTVYLSDEEDRELKECEKLKEELAEIVDIIDLTEKYERFLELTRKILLSEDKIDELHANLDTITKKSREWIEDVQLSGPAICEELMNVSVAVKESKKQYTFSIECLERSLVEQMTTFLVEHFQKLRIKLLLKHREDIDAEALSCELASLCLMRKRQPRESKYEQEEQMRELTVQRKLIDELRKRRNAAKYSREVALKNAEREEAELKKDRSDMCIDVSFQRAALCKTLKKAHLSGAKVDDFTHSHDFTCTDIVLG
ncbi:hypothetical protein PRIPAC_95938 [Pristionchus pacificus]|uniref:Uncharacterized protein n=1 Tax=Pristionchus pacificus TaxID=54126 RepID=A0A2A6BDI5_PRIPA|nr:hypothetical protein PRIPAC_95938 [Pristionchus pacificus]|eukprot:PDM63943.1 hypothetical protein PRIPAC_49444 [Pristionchus pacificus]